MNYYKNNIRHVKGDTFSSAVIVEGLGQALDSIFFTCRDGLNEDSTVLFEKGLNNGISIVEYDEEHDIRKYAVRISPVDTKDLQSGTYYYDLQIGVNNDVFTIMKGKFILEQDVTRKEVPDDPELYIKVILDEINGEIIGVTVRDKTSYLSDTKELIKDSINLTGAALTENDTFRSYATKLEDSLINVINEGTDVIFDNFPQTTDEDEVISLENTLNAKMKLDLKGNTKQDGTPTPTAPVEVKTVTGGQVVSITKESSSQSYEINLGKNLNFTPYANGTSKTTNGITFTVDSDGTITANGTATANAYFYCHTQDITPYLNIEKDIYYLSGGVNSNCKLILRLYNNTTSGANFTDSGNGVSADTRNYTYNRIMIFIQIDSGTTCDNVVFKPMLEKGSVATGWSAYKTPIELCKIGDYKDRIYKDNGKWYIEKQIGRDIYTGASNENWTYYQGIVFIDNSNIKSEGANVSNINFLTNYFTPANAKCYISHSTGQRLHIRLSEFDLSNITSVAEWKTWLSTHNLYFYYILATPTITEITDSELIYQLEALQNAKSYEDETNISSLDANVPFIINATALTKGSE